MSAPNAILLHEKDNVLICTRPILEGSPVICAEIELTAADTIDIGHKIARTDMQAGDKVYRYGAPIGSMTAAVRSGGHVHTHNLKSDYIPTHSRQDQKEP